MFDYFLKVRTFKKLCFFILSVCLVSCAVMPKELKEEFVEKEISLRMVKENFNVYQEKKIMWGGKIIRCENENEGTFFEILQLPLDVEGRPKDVDQSEGRFIAFYEGFLDCAIYHPQREITVVGEIKEIKKGEVGKMEYVYPLVKVIKLHLWEKRKETIEVYHHFYPYYCPPYWWYYPWYW